jgi:beta-xylosidase
MRIEAVGWIAIIAAALGCAAGSPAAPPGRAGGAAQATYTNPIVSTDCPDPSVIRVDEPTPVHYLVCTSDTPVGQGRNAYPIRRSTDLVRWTEVGFIFPSARHPAWATGDFWAPEIHRVQDRFMAYFSARDKTGQLCVGAARSDAITGPWTDVGAPLVRDERVGMIDVHYFRDDDGKQYLYWKEDGNGLTPKGPTPIYVQELAADGFTLQGQRSTVLTNDLEWEAHVVEGAWVIKRNGFYYLIYSGHAYDSDRYAVGVARSSSPRGPFEKKGDPILRSDERWAGPGHGAVHTIRGKDYYVYHAWETGKVGPPHGRMTMLDRVEWQGGWPGIHDGTPSSAPVPMP